jgi:hypothetical protein
MIRMCTHHPAEVSEDGRAPLFARAGMRPLAAIVLAIVIAALAATAEPATPAPVRVVDRTLVCTTGYHGGARILYLRAQAAYGSGGKLDWLAGIYLSTPGNPDPTNPNYRPSLAGVNAGWPPPPPLKSGGLGFASRLCAPSKERVGLSRRGLVGGVASQTGDDYSCVVPRRVLVRVRAVFRAPVELKPIGRRTYVSAEGRVEQGQVAVRTLSSKPLVYGDVREAGRARLFTTGGCG